MGCEVSRRGQSYSLKAPGWDNAARMSKKLGKGYSEAELRAVLAGEKEHTPTRATLHPEPKQDSEPDGRYSGKASRWQGGRLSAMGHRLQSEADGADYELSLRA